MVRDYTKVLEGYTTGVLSRLLPDCILKAFQEVRKYLRQTGAMRRDFLELSRFSLVALSGAVFFEKDAALAGGFICLCDGRLPG